MFLGAKAYGRTNQIKPWYGSLYIATYRMKNKVKIGITSNLRARDDQLRLKSGGQDPSNIIYCWSMPTNEEIESKVKQLLFLFTRRYTKEPGKTEIFYLPLYPFILIVRLIILYTFIKKRYISQISEKAKQAESILKSYIDTLRIDSVKYGDVVYKRQDEYSSDVRIRLIRETIELMDNLYNLWNGTGFLPDYYAQDVQEAIDRARPVLISNKDWYKKSTRKNKEKYDWIKAWLDEFTIIDNNVRRPSAEALELTQEEKDEKQRSAFQRGDLVTVVYPDNEDNRSHGWVGSWHARIKEYKPPTANQVEAGYLVEWLEKTPAGENWTNTTVPEKWIQRDDILNRTIDVLELYKQLGLDTTIEIASTVEGVNISNLNLL